MSACGSFSRNARTPAVKAGVCMAARLIMFSDNANSENALKSRFQSSTLRGAHEKGSSFFSPALFAFHPRIWRGRGEPGCRSQAERRFYTVLLGREKRNVALRTQPAKDE